MKTNKNLYLFDFDGTITSKDSYIDFFLKSFRSFYLFRKIIVNLPSIILAYFKKDKSDLKELLTSIFLSNYPLDSLNAIAKKYFEENKDKIVYDSAINEIKKINKNPNNELYIVSASLDLWLIYFANDFDAKLICTELNFKDNNYQGFKTKNCNGKEKATRIKATIKLDNYQNIIAYGNSSGDNEMFELATETYYKPFK